MRTSFFFSLIFVLLLPFLQLPAQTNELNTADPEVLLQIVQGNNPDSTIARACLQLVEHFARFDSDTALFYCRKAQMIAERKLKSSSGGTLKAYQFILGSAFFQLACIYHMNSHFESAEHHYRDALNIQEKANDKRGMAQTMNNLSRLYQRKGDNKTFFKITQQAIEIQRSINDSVGIAVSLIALGDQHARQGNTDSCLASYHEALAILRSSKYPEKLAFCLYNLGLMLEKTGDIETAASHLFEALKIQEDLGVMNEAINTLFGIGQLYKNQGAYENARKYYKRIMELNKNSGNLATETKVYSNLAGIAALEKDHQQSLKYYEKSLRTAEEIQLGPGVIALLTNNVGRQHYKLGELSTALKFMERSLEIGHGISLPEHTAKKLHDIGKIYLELGQLSQAQKYAKEGLLLSREIGYPGNIMEATFLLSSIQEKQGNLGMALANFKLAVTLKDSINNESIKQQLVEQEAKYKIEKKEQEILLNERKISLLQKDAQLKNYTLYGAAGSFVFILLIGLLVFFNYYQKRKRDESEIRNQLRLHIKESELLRLRLHTQLIEGPGQSGPEMINEELNEYLDTRLSKRELEVLSELSKGKSNKEISDALFVSVNTVRSHLLNIYHKLDVKNRTQAVKKAGNLSQLNR